ncbi:MAG: hypothetical protein J6T10_29735 [Methanobrevibacter sp.]|nr:hypothetical protein [Methanobrevibacter sp.]
MADDIVLEEESGEVTPTIYPEEVDITVGEVTIEHDSVTYEVDAGELPAEASTTAGVAKYPAGSLYPSYSTPAYSLKSVEIQTAGTGYSINDELTIDLDIKDAKLKVTGVSAGEPTNAAIANRALAVTGYFDETTGAFIPSDDPQYAMSGYAVGDTFTMSVAQGDTSPVFTVASVEDGVITGLTVTTAGSITIDSEHSDSFDAFLDSDSWTYLPVGENNGGGAILHVYFSRVYEGGGDITEVVITEAGSNESNTVENPVSVTGGTGTGAKFNLTLE